MSALDTTVSEPLVRGVRLRLRRALAFLAWRAERSAEPADSIALVLDDGGSRQAEAAWQAATPELADIAAAIAAAEGALAGPEGRWSRLVVTFALGAEEAHALAAAVACALEPGLQRAFAALDGLRGRSAPTAAHVARLWGHERVVLAPTAALLRWELVREVYPGPDGPAVLVADAAIVAWLAGSALEDEALLGAGALVEPRAALPEWPLEPALVCLAAIGGAVRLRIVGVAGSGRRTFAAGVASSAWHQRLYALEVGPPDGERAVTPERGRLRWRRACRRVRLLEEALALVGPPPRDAELELAPERMVLVVTPQDVVPPLATVAEPTINLPLPDVAARRALWAAAIPGAGQWPATELDELAARHRVTVAEIASVAALGVRDARGASDAIRAASRGLLAGLAQRLDCTFTFADLLAGPLVRDALDDFVFEARERLLLWEEPRLRRLFPLGTGLLALFCGPPGTGKTMSAQIIARELGLDLYRIDLAAVVSKYVGETARNLDRVLATAGRMDVVLFFDEADALFGKRTDIKDAHDRYANTDTNYLLQAVEGYRGIALLATNRKGNVDPAFLRRLRHVVEFQTPDAGLRLQLWEHLVQAIAGEAVCASARPALPTLAASFELSGAQIKYAVLHSLYASRREQVGLRVRHLVGGIERELQKEGRGIGRSERERLLALDKAATA